MEYIKGFVVLFLILMFLVQMVPGEKFQKYIHFFSEVILLIGVMHPIMDALGKSDSFLEKIEFETFIETLEGASKDAEQIACMQEDFYQVKYENMVSMEVASQIETYGYEVSGVEVSLTDEYEVDSIIAVVKEKESGEISVGKIVIDGVNQEQMQEEIRKEDAAYQELKNNLIKYYDLTEQQLSIVYE